jgi:hypothetical protein
MLMDSIKRQPRDHPHSVAPYRGHRLIKERGTRLALSVALNFGKACEATATRHMQLVKRRSLSPNFGQKMTTRF